VRRAAVLGVPARARAAARESCAHAVRRRRVRPAAVQPRPPRLRHQVL